LNRPGLTLIINLLPRTTSWKKYLLLESLQSYQSHTHPILHPIPSLGLIGGRTGRRRVISICSTVIRVLRVLKFDPFLLTASIAALLLVVAIAKIPVVLVILVTGARWLVVSIRVALGSVLRRRGTRGIVCWCGAGSHPPGSVHWLLAQLSPATRLTEEHGEDDEKEEER